MKTAILCGGKGTRAYPHTVDVPKPLLDVGGRPVLSHVLEIYANQGFRDFVLAAGYKRDLIEEWAGSVDASWHVEVVDTGLETNTGGRIARLADRLGERFFVTYADGLGDIDLRALLDFHDGHPGCATLTTVPLPSQYGTLAIDGSGRVQDFREKPRLSDHPINAGFFVFDRRAFEWWAGDDLERHVLPALGAAGELYAYRHDGFWKSMDTHKDSQELSALFEHGRGPWSVEPTTTR